jgi:hypothetical protein
VLGACVKLPRRRFASEARALYHSPLAANNVSPLVRPFCCPKRPTAASYHDLEDDYDQNA